MGSRPGALRLSFKKRTCFLLWDSVFKLGLPISLFVCSVLIRGSHLIVAITGARELGQAAEVPQRAAGPGWGTTGCPGTDTPQDVTESWPCGGGGLLSVPLKDVTGRQAVGQRLVRQQWGHRGHRTAQGHTVWASGQPWPLRRAEQGASSWRRWEWTGGCIQDAELLAKGICNFSCEQGHQAPMQA